MTRDNRLVELHDIHKTYTLAQREVPVLSGITMSVERGEFAALQGASGSGKSTLLYIIGLLDRPTQGRYLLAGRDVADLTDDEASDTRNTTTGFVFQSFHLIPYITALHNVLLPGLYTARPRSELTERARDLLDQVGLADRMDFKPGQLSGGQQQRVAVARALLNDPDLILADEPTGQLDSSTSDELMRTLQRINEAGKTVLLVTHDAATADYASRTIHLKDGRIAD
jgi:putative ABC transport system ATP-binding protein